MPSPFAVHVNYYRPPRCKVVAHPNPLFVLYHLRSFLDEPPPLVGFRIDLINQREKTL